MCICLVNFARGRSRHWPTRRRRCTEQLSTETIIRRCNRTNSRRFDLCDSKLTQRRKKNTVFFNHLLNVFLSPLQLIIIFSVSKNDARNEWKWWNWKPFRKRCFRCVCFCGFSQHRFFFFVFVFVSFVVAISWSIDFDQKSLISNRTKEKRSEKDLRKETTTAEVRLHWNN